MALGIVAATAGTAHGQVRQDESDEARAEAVFGEGLRLADRGQWPAAAQRLRTSLELRPEDDRTRYHLARSLSELGHVTEATRHLRAIVHSGAPDPIIREAATELLMETEPKIGMLIVQLEGEVDGSTLLVDEIPVSASDAEEGISVDPGPHVVTVTDPDGGALARRRVDVEEGGAAHLELTVAPTPQAAARTVVEGDTQGQPFEEDQGEAITSKWWFWTGIGAVVVGAVVTTVALSVGGDSPTEGDAPPVRVRGNSMGVNDTR